MIYHEVISDNILEIFFNLEELICLKNITEQKCAIKIKDELKHIFDLSEFELTQEIPDNAIICDISGYVCVYENDFNDVYGSEFISYRKNQTGQIFRLDKFDFQDLNLIFSKPNFYESKYWSSKKNYREAIMRACNFDIDDLFNLNKGFSRLPLIIIDPSIVNDRISFDFDECYYINNPGNFLELNKIKGHDILEILSNYNISFSSTDKNLLLMSMKCFTKVYGVPGDLLFNFFGKKIEQCIIGNQTYGTISNYKFNKVNKNASFEFSQMFLNIGRTELLSFLRFRFIDNFV